MVLLSSATSAGGPISPITTHPTARLALASPDESPVPVTYTGPVRAMPAKLPMLSMDVSPPWDMRAGGLSDAGDASSACSSGAAVVGSAAVLISVAAGMVAAGVVLTGTAVIPAAMLLVAVLLVAVLLVTVLMGPKASLLLGLVWPALPSVLGMAICASLKVLGGAEAVRATTNTLGVMLAYRACQQQAKEGQHNA